MNPENNQPEVPKDGKMHKNPRIHKTDNPIIGFLSGLVFIVVGLVVMYFLRHGHFSFERYLKIFTAFDNPVLMSEASKILSLSILALLAPFYYFLNKSRYYATRGVLIVAFIVGALVVCYKFIW